MGQEKSDLSRAILPGFPCGTSRRRKDNLIAGANRDRICHEIRRPHFSEELVANRD